MKVDTETDITESALSDETLNTLIQVVESGGVYVSELPCEQVRELYSKYLVLGRSDTDGEYITANVRGKQHYCAAFGCNTVREARIKRLKSLSDAGA